MGNFQCRFTYGLTRKFTLSPMSFDNLFHKIGCTTLKSRMNSMLKEETVKFLRNIG